MIVFTPDYILRSADETVNFLFNTRAIRRYCEDHKLELADFYLKVQKALTEEAAYSEDLKEVKDFRHDDLGGLLLAGAESWCVYNKIPFDVTELDVDYWIDSLGGLVAQKMAFANILIAIAKRMVPESNGQEKKSKAKAVSQ